MIELKLVDGWDCHLIYNVSGSIEGNIEVQFDNGLFNGKILFAKDSSDENGELEWDDVTDKHIYEIIKEQAIKDYWFVSC